MSQDASAGADAARLRGAAERRGRSAETALRPRQARPRPSISSRHHRERSPARTSPAAPISTSAAPRRASPCRAAPTPFRCPRCSACWWRGTARPRPRRCWVRSAAACPRFGRRAASRLGRSRKSEGEITLKANTLTLGSALKVQGATLAASVGKDGLVDHRPQRPSVRRGVCRLGHAVAARQRRRARPRAPTSRAASSKTLPRASPDRASPRVRSISPSPFRAKA